MAESRRARPRRGEPRIGLVPVLVVSLLAGVVGVLPPAASASARVRPQVQSCPPSEQFLKSSQGRGFYGTGQTAWVYNYNTNGLSKTLTTSTGNTIGYSLQASQSVNAGVIFASADASFSEGVTYTHDDSSTQSTTVYNIPIGEYGIIQIGNEMGIVKGTYEVINSYCQISQKTYVTGIFPLDQPSGTAGGYNTTSTPPWPQSRVVSS
jgi:hypothetical protein